MESAERERIMPGANDYELWKDHQEEMLRATTNARLAREARAEAAARDTRAVHRPAEAVQLLGRRERRTG